MAGIRVLTDGPEFEALPDPLWEAAQHPEPAGPHWQQGVTWQEWCGVGGDTTYDECLAVTGSGAPPAPGDLAVTGDGCVARGATAFTVYSRFSASLIGLPDEDQAERALARTEAYQTSRAVWTGRSGGQAVVWPHLAAGTVLDDPQGIRLQTGAETVPGAPSDPAVALGALESRLAAVYGGRGVIHVPPTVLPVLLARTLVSAGDGGALYSPAGHRIVSAPGYDGSGPDGTAPTTGTAWMYATGALFGYRSEVFVRDMPGTFDRATNTVSKLASRTYLYGWECAHLAAQVNLPA